jgi:hypothetical protein
VAHQTPEALAVDRRLLDRVDPGQDVAPVAAAEVARLALVKASPWP